MYQERKVIEGFGDYFDTDLAAIATDLWGELTEDELANKISSSIVSWNGDCIYYRFVRDVDE